MNYWVILAVWLATVGWALNGGSTESAIAMAVYSIGITTGVLIQWAYDRYYLGPRF